MGLLLYKSFVTKMKSNTILELCLNLWCSVGSLLLLFSMFIVMRATLFLVLHFFSLFPSCIQAVLQFVILCLSELDPIIPSFLQFTTDLTLLLLGRYSFACTVGLILVWVDLKYH